MLLKQGLRLRRGNVVCFVGAGGKSTSILRLAEELIQDMPVVVTTTTKIGAHQRGLAHAHLICQQPHDLDVLSDLLARFRSVLVTGSEMREEPKLPALASPLLERVREISQGQGACLLIECDGARQRSLKAPAEYEPVLPAFATHVVVVAGVDVLGTPIDGPLVHRPTLVARILDAPPDTLIQAEHVSRLLSHREGGLKGIPAGAEVRVLLNKAEGAEALEKGRLVAHQLLANARVQGVLLAAVQQTPPLEEMHGRVAGVVLAAGGSSRLGRPKQLVCWKGVPLVVHAVRAAKGAGLRPLVVVTGHQERLVEQALVGEGTALIHNADWEMGLSTSVKTGLAAVEQGVEGAVFLLADTPHVDAALVRALLQRHRLTLSPLVAPHAGGRRANPVLFDRSTFPALRELQGDAGGRVLFERFACQEVEWDESILLDVDTEADVRKLQGAS
jgi:molybdenum cofactor cytidylyltransferase